MSRLPSKPADQRAYTSVDGRLLPAGRAVIPIEDWGFRFGWGLFETIRIHHGIPLFADRHLERMRQGSARLQLNLGADGWWFTETARLLAKSGIPEGAMNWYVTRGNSPEFQPRRILVVRPSPASRRELGRVWIAPWRIDPTNPVLGCKTLAYLPNLLASESADAAGFDDAIVVNSRGRVADGARASVFVLEKGVLRTPAFRDGALAGVVRQIILEAASAGGMKTRSGGLTVADLHRAEGIFLTSSLRGLRLARKLGETRLHPTTRAIRVFRDLQSAYRRAIRLELKSAGS